MSLLFLIVGCYFEAVQLTTEGWARMHLPKCLLMLVKDGASPGVLCQTLENRGGELPPWVWLPWMPYLLSCLCRIEGRAAKAILAQLVRLYPQAIYYALRSFYLERRDVDRAKGNTTPGGHMGSVSYAEDLMSTLRRSHASLWSSLEAILEELIVKFRPSYEEELLSTISALIERADSQAGTTADSSDATRGDDTDTTMLASVAKTVGRIAIKFFPPSPRSTSEAATSRNDERTRKTAEFKSLYKAKFESDFQVSSCEKDLSEEGPQLSLDEYLTLLKRWRRKLEIQVSFTPLALPLMESSRALSMFAADSPDLWPGACDPAAASNYEGRPRNHFESEARPGQSTTSSSAVAAKKAASIAATAVASAAAREGVGGHFGGGSSCVEIPGQYPPNSRSSDLKPSPELHAKLVSFGPTIQVLRREQLVRRVIMVGSDGTIHHFLLNFAIPYWTRTDERVAQTNYVLDKLLRKDWRSLRRHLSVEPTAVIPVAQRLRMTADASSRVSLDEIYKLKCIEEEKDPNAAIDFFNEELTKTRTQEDQENQGKTVTTSRADVFASACRKTSSMLLLRHVSAALGNAEALFHFRRAFSDQLAANSLLQYAFSVVERTPSRVVFTQSNGRVQSPDFRVSYNSQGKRHLAQFPSTLMSGSLLSSPI
jgi:transformation/transcription domain-associated protein